MRRRHPAAAPSTRGGRGDAGGKDGSRGRACGSRASPGLGEAPDRVAPREGQEVCHVCGSREPRHAESISHAAATEAAVDVEAESTMLLAALDGLRGAAEEALERAVKAEARAAAEEEQRDLAERIQRALERRLRDCVVSEVQQAVRAVAEEATAELRAAAAEIRQLRAGGGRAVAEGPAAEKGGEAAASPSRQAAASPSRSPSGRPRFVQVHDPRGSRGSSGSPGSPVRGTSPCAKDPPQRVTLAVPVQRGVAQDEADLPMLDPDMARSPSKEPLRVRDVVSQFEQRQHRKGRRTPRACTGEGPQGDAGGTLGCAQPGHRRTLSAESSEQEASFGVVSLAWSGAAALGAALAWTGVTAPGEGAEKEAAAKEEVAAGSASADLAEDR